MLLLVIFEILGLVVNILTADNKCSLRNSQNLQQPIQMQLFNKHQTFSNVFAPILKSTSNPGQFEKKKMILLAYVFTKLETPKKVVS